MAAVKKKLPSNKKKKKTSSKGSTTKVSVSLPTELSVPSTNLGDYAILIYGAKKIGKTTMCSYFPKSLFLMFEPGAKALSVYQRSITKWEEFKEYVKLLKKDKKFNTVIIDTADFMYDLAFDYVCRKLLIDHPSEEAWGKGWKKIKEELYTEVKNLFECGKGIVFLSHATERTITRRDGSEYDVTESSMAKQLRELIEGLVDIWALYEYNGKNRTLILQGDDQVDAGQRIEGGFRYADGSPIQVIDMGKNAEEAFNNFNKAFHNKLSKPEVKVKKKKALKKKK